MEIQLKRLRKEAGYRSRRDFADALGEGFTERRITSWESGERMISLEQACILADFLHCSLDELAGRRFTPPERESSEEARLAAAVSSLSDEGREVALNVVSGLASTYPRKP